MLKYCQFIRRREENSGAEFRVLFDRYLPLVRPVADSVGATAVRVSIGLDVAQNDAIMAARGTRVPFDAMVEIYAPQLAGVFERIPKPLLDAMLAFQREHFDLERCVFFIAEEL